MIQYIVNSGMNFEEAFALVLFATFILGLVIIVPVCFTVYYSIKIKLEHITNRKAIESGYSAVQLDGCTEWVWQNKSAEKENLE